MLLPTETAHVMPSVNSCIATWQQVKTCRLTAYALYEQAQQEAMLLDDLAWSQQVSVLVLCSHAMVASVVTCILLVAN